MGSCLTLRNELFKETHRQFVLTKQEILLESVGTALPLVSKSQSFMVMGLVSGLSLADLQTQSPSWWLTHCSDKMDVSKKDLAGGSTRGVSF